MLSLQTFHQTNRDDALTRPCVKTHLGSFDGGLPDSDPERASLRNCGETTGCHIIRRELSDSPIGAEEAGDGFPVPLADDRRCVTDRKLIGNLLIGNLIPSGLRQRMGGEGLGERGKLRGLPAPRVALDTTRFTIRTLHLRPVGTTVLARRPSLGR